MKKKIAMLMLAVTLVMTACGSDAKTGSSDPKGSVEQGNEDADDSKEAEEYTVGKYTDTGYESEYMGFRFTTPEGCTLMTQEQLLQLAGVTIDVLADDFNEQMMEHAKNAMIYELFAAYESTTTNINVILQPTDTSSITLDQVIDASVQQLEAMTAMDCTVSDERSTVTIAGQEYTKLSVDTVANGASLKQEVYIALLPDRMVNITLTYTEGNEAERDALLAAFTEL